MNLNSELGTTLESHPIIHLWENETQRKIREIHLRAKRKVMDWKFPQRYHGEKKRKRDGCEGLEARNSLSVLSLSILDSSIPCKEISQARKGWSAESKKDRKKEKKRKKKAATKHHLSVSFFRSPSFPPRGQRFDPTFRSILPVTVGDGDEH